mmetsp:Transcript_41989/g.75387  ORF Transcript_41989/g.75387 Transcript_41989/m.75387 type:complete len:228 (-) Transcript_41989:1836-2519(-)
MPAATSRSSDSRNWGSSTKVSLRRSSRREPCSMHSITSNGSSPTTAPITVVMLGWRRWTTSRTSSSNARSVLSSRWRVLTERRAVASPGEAGGNEPTPALSSEPHESLLSSGSSSRCPNTRLKRNCARACQAPLFDVPPSSPADSSATIEAALSKRRRSSDLLCTGVERLTSAPRELPRMCRSRLFRRYSFPDSRGKRPVSAISPALLPVEPGLGNPGTDTVLPVPA